MSWLVAFYIPVLFPISVLVVLTGILTVLAGNQSVLPALHLQELIFWYMAKHHLLVPVRKTLSPTTILDDLTVDFKVNS